MNNKHSRNAVIKINMSVYSERKYFDGLLPVRGEIYEKYFRNLRNSISPVTPTSL